MNIQLSALFAATAVLLCAGYAAADSRSPSADPELLPRLTRHDPPDGVFLLRNVEMNWMSVGAGAPQPDRNMAGRPIRAGGMTFARGVVCQAPVEWLIDLSGTIDRLELALGVEVAAGGDPQVADLLQGGFEGGRLGLIAGIQHGLDAGVAGRAERDAFALTIDHQAGRHRLHPARGQLGHHLLPQHRADLVAVEPVEDAPGLLGVDEPAVDVGTARVSVFPAAAPPPVMT